VAHVHLPTRVSRRATTGSGGVRALIVAVLLLALLTIAGLVLWWPGRVPPRDRAALGPAPRLTNATVVEVRDCGAGCQQVTVRLEHGGQVALSETSYGPGLTLHDGQAIVVASDASDPNSYSFADFQRGPPLGLLAALFALVVIVVARWRGLAALGGVVVTWLMLVKFVLPALLTGESPVMVAVIGSSAVMLVVLYLVHGISVRTTTALVGTLVSLGLTAGLASVFTGLTRVSGAASDEATYLQTVIGQVDLRGVVLAGVVIGSLGVLNDVTVTQASAVWELADASPAYSVGQLYRAGMRVGRDHIASAVYTLVLAYAGASLPLLLLFTVADQPVGRILTGDAVAEEILRTLIGAIGLVAAVPITTVLAATLAARASRVVRRRPTAAASAASTASAGWSRAPDR
jgi:uncharacterized membrane protein